MKKLLIAIMLLFVTQICTTDAKPKKNTKTTKQKKKKSHKKKVVNTNKKKASKPKKVSKKKANKKGRSGWAKITSSLSKAKELHSQALENKQKFDDARQMAEDMKKGGVKGALGKASGMAKNKLNEALESTEGSDSDDQGSEE